MRCARGAMLLVGAILPAAAVAQRPAALEVRNNHEFAYRGPVEMSASVADGHYAGPMATADIRNGVARIMAALPPRSAVRLSRTGPAAGRPFADGPMSVAPVTGGMALRWRGVPVAELALGLAVIEGTRATADDAVRQAMPLALEWREGVDGVLRGVARQSGYSVTVAASPYGDGFMDVRATLVREAPAAGRAYVALVRRLVTPGASDARLRFNGRTFDGGRSPSVWDRDFWYVHGVDWLSWRAGGRSLLAVNGFTPAPTVKHDSTWGEASHFYVRERTRQAGDTVTMVSEIAGSNAEQATSRYMSVIPYAPPQPGDTVALRYRLAVADSVPAGWEEVQLRAFAGARPRDRAHNAERVSLGVPATTFGVAYFPYSTFTENFDFYRVSGLTSESFWPVSAPMWRRWREFVPRMRSDLHIIRAMGFDAVRLHHLELLRVLPRDEALAFLDFFAGEARALDLGLMVDSEGPADWLSLVLGRYRDQLTGVELENEILIGGIRPADPARWTALYAAARAAAPGAQVFLTGAGNNAMFERLRTLGVPFDRVGLHAYKHGPQWIEAFGSHVLGTAGYASDIGRPMTLGEFNWKDLTRLSPSARRDTFATLYRTILAPRAVPELFQFQLQEQMAFNTTVAGTSSRHYEPLGLDRRPKPEAFVAMRLMREFGRADAPVRELPVQVEEARFADGRAVAAFTITNGTSAPLSVTIGTESFDGSATRLMTPARVRIAAGGVSRGRVELRLPQAAPVGTYHHFVRVTSGARRSLGWGVASNEGAPSFADTSVLGNRVRYAPDAGVVHAVDWSRPLAVAYGDRAGVLELEQAYQLANTLQAATGRPVWISSDADLPDSLATRGTLLLVGTALTSTRVAQAGIAATPGVGTIALHAQSGRQWLVLTGADARGVEAAVVELELRYWPRAKDAAIRIVGMEPGAALGHRARGSSVDLP